MEHDEKRIRLMPNQLAADELSSWIPSQTTSADDDNSFDVGDHNDFHDSGQPQAPVAQETPDSASDATGKRKRYRNSVSLPCLFY